ncbi:MAG: S-layer homology domain-containing protein [bacterium]|nr:S-layer homology domain-containing protein [bacterium]
MKEIIKKRYIAYLLIFPVFIGFLFSGKVCANNFSFSDIDVSSNQLSQHIVKTWNDLLDKIEKNDGNISVFSRKEVVSPSTKPKFESFVDIQNDPYQYAIQILQEKKLVRGYNNKYLPNNHVHLYMLIKTLMHSYRFSAHYKDIKCNPYQKQYFHDGNLDKESMKCINSAYAMGFLDNI